jgi:hypothetical protein
MSVQSTSKAFCDTFLLVVAIPPFMHYGTQSFDNSVENPYDFVPERDEPIGVIRTDKILAKLNERFDDAKKSGNRFGSAVNESVLFEGMNQTVKPDLWRLKYIKPLLDKRWIGELESTGPKIEHLYFITEKGINYYLKTVKNRLQMMLAYTLDGLTQYGT